MDQYSAFVVKPNRGRLTKRGVFSCTGMRKLIPSRNGSTFDMCGVLKKMLSALGRPGPGSQRSFTRCRCQPLACKPARVKWAKFDEQTHVDELLRMLLYMFRSKTIQRQNYTNN